MGKILDYAIKYKVVKLAEDKFLLFPLYLLKGESDAFVMSDGKEVLPVANYYKDLNENQFVADRLYSLDELEEMYDFEHDGSDFLANYFFDDYKDTLIYIEVDLKNDILKKNEINLKMFEERKFDLTYFLDKKKPVMALNIDSLNELISEDDIAKIKLLLTKYQKQMEAFSDSFSKQGVTRINVENGEIRGFDLSKKINELVKKKTMVDLPKDNEIPGDFSYNGLCKYIKDRVLGHDKEIDTIAKILYLNATAQKEDGTESLLITGPTGVGKTETIKAASEYLNIPYVEANAANLVPQGIKGTSLEDLLATLYLKENYNLEKAQKGLFFLDEFDKLNESELEIKSAIKNILLTFTQGGIFPIEKDEFNIIFDTSMLSKVFAGVFQNIRENHKTIGFNDKKTEKEIKTELDLRKKIIEKQYFTQEELSRINYIIEYKDLDKETRKRILLYSKLSELKKKINRYKRDFGIEIIPEDEYINALLEKIDADNQGMRVANNLVKESLDEVEKEILRNNVKNKKIILTRNTALDNSNFNIS